MNIDNLMNNIQEEFDEVYYDEKDALIKGIIDGKFQSIEISDGLVRKAKSLIEILKKYKNNKIVLRNNKTSTEEKLSLLQALKILKKYQLNILHRYKGLGENSPEDIKTTIMDPNTRTLIKVHIGDVVNDMKIFQTLRGNSPLDAKNRKQMMAEFKVEKEMIDT